MKFTLRTFGSPLRHITSFEKNTISKLNRFTHLKNADLTFDKSHNAERFFLTLQIIYDNNKKIIAKTDGATQYEALVKGVSLIKSKIKETRAKDNPSIFPLSSRNILQRAV